MIQLPAWRHTVMTWFQPLQALKPLEAYGASAGVHPSVQYPVLEKGNTYAQLQFRNPEDIGQWIH